MERALALADFHGMVDAKLVAPFGTAALQDIAAIRAAHALAEAMRLHLMPNIRLIRSFHWVSSSILGNNPCIIAQIFHVPQHRQRGAGITSTFNKGASRLF